MQKPVGQCPIIAPTERCIETDYESFRIKNRKEILGTMTEIPGFRISASASGIGRGRVYRWRWSRNGWKPAAWKASGKVARRELAAVESHFFERFTHFLLFFTFFN
ncbi:hypothetical protein LXL04_022349 [Taraxacum kok-saghyz]